MMMRELKRIIHSVGETLFPPLVKGTLNTFGAKLSEENLIRFDYRVVSFVTLCAVLFCLQVALMLHGSSSAMWNQYVPDKSGESLGLLTGTPKFIRFDEWAVATPWILSQVSRGFPLRNENIGAGSAPSVINLPVKSFPGIVRPQYWGFFLLHVERGFAFYWNFKVFGLVLGAFFLLMLITQNNFWLSLFGSLWLFFSSFIQWWFSTPAPEMILSFCFLCVSITYLLFSTKPTLIILSALLAFVSSVTFVLAFYPPYQIPLAYLFAFLFLGLLLEHYDKERFRLRRGLKLVSILLFLVLILLVLYIFYGQSKETVELVVNTEYPGNRISAGGDIELERYFSEFLGIFIFNERIGPHKWKNVCEASNFLMFFPLVIALVIKDFFSRKRVDFTELLLIGYLAFLSTWMLVGLPASVAHVTLLDRVPPIRALIGVGAANILLLVRFLAHDGRPQEHDNPKLVAPNVEKRKRPQKTTPKSKATSILAKYGINLKVLAGVALVFAILMLYGTSTSEILGNYFSKSQIVMVSLVFSFVSCLFLLRKKTVLALVILFMVVRANYSVNPVARGLGPVLEKDLTKLATDIHQKDPSGKWVVYGDNIIANFITASGASVFNGTKFPPELDEFRILDPESKNKSIYNRYAHIQVTENEGARSPEDVNFSIHQSDKYNLFVNPCSEKLEKIGVRYFVFETLPTKEELDCLSPISDTPINRFWVYRRKSSSL